MNHLKQIAARLPEYGLDAMLLNSEPGEYYAVGFHGEGNVVVTAQGCFYFTDSRYIEAANHLITGAEIAMTGRSRNYRAMVQEVVNRCRIRKLGFEEGYLSVADYNLWKEGLTAELVPAQKLVDALRARYGRDRLFLLGHSWGSLLGGLYALRRPEKLSAWLPVSQMVDFKRSEQVSAAEAIRRARGAGREEDAERLAQELEQVLALGPENVTVHTLALKKGSRLMEEGGGLPSGAAVADMLDFAWAALRAAGQRPYYLYRQKYMSGSFENVGWCRPGAESLYNICMMEELHTIVSLGGGGVTKLIDRATGHIERLANAKYPQEYIQKIDAICADKARVAQFYAAHGR